MIDDPRLERVLEELLESGGSPEEACRSCPELLPQVRSELQRLRLLEREVDAIFPSSEPRDGAGPAALATDELPRIRGYDVQAVLGHGGMGVVYRARHLRLGRPVALKMLLAGPYAGRRERERFQREAEAVAGLRHANIVQLYDAGDLEGRPYFTMEFVEGGSLAQKIGGMPQPARPSAALLTQVAEAVHFAHQSGIVHRDLKPANILLATDGTPKVTDFGLARRLEGGSGLTLSGVPMGTPSYMAPEQARGEKGAVGPATDVYALGAILYEMLTGRPPFRAETSSGTLQQVLHEDPVPPSRLNPQVPRDLATICLKCLSKEPQRRYASAAALAEDLGRFLRAESIAARRAGPLERLARWARRSPAAAALLAVTLLVATTVLGAGGWLIGRQILTARAVKADLRDADRWQQQSAFPEAGATLERAKSRLGDGGPFWLYPVVEAARRDHQFLVQLETIRLNRWTLVEGHHNHAALLRFNKARADRNYAEAFRDHGLGDPPNDPQGVAARVRAFKWAAHIVAALDDWAVCAVDSARQDRLLEAARRADPDPWRDRVRDPAFWRDGKALADLAREAPLPDQPVPLLLALGERLSATGEDAVGFLGRVQEQYPDEFWVNFALALALHDAGRRHGGDPAPALVYYERALKIRPDALAVQNDVALVLIDKHWLGDNERTGRGPGAVTVFHQLVRNAPHFAPGFNNLGVAWKHKGDWQQAGLAFQDALYNDPELAPAHINLGEVRAGSGDLIEAIPDYRRALQLDPNNARAHHLLGVALVATARGDEANDFYPEGVQSLVEARGQALTEGVAHYWQAHDCDPKWISARNPLRMPPQGEARLKEAINHFREAVRLEPQFAQAHGALGQALLAQREFTEAEAETRRGLDLLSEWDKKVRANLEGQRQRCQRLRALEGRLPAVVQGKDRPAAADCLDLAELCFAQNHFATAARLYAEALAATPGLTEDLRAGNRFNAARAAAMAGGGHGDDSAALGEPEREELRRQARDWLRLDLLAWAKKLETGTAADRIQAQKTLSPWQDDPDLAGLRDTETLDRLPPSERDVCRALWQDVAALLRRAQTTKGA
jgi:serine/threonine-protein kinase